MRDFVSVFPLFNDMSLCTLHVNTYSTCMYTYIGMCSRTGLILCTLYMCILYAFIKYPQMPVAITCIYYVRTVDTINAKQQPISPCKCSMLL